MEEIKVFILKHQPIVGALIAGTCAIIAAIIRRDRTPRPAHVKKPIVRALMFSLVAVVIGGGLLAAENFVMPFDPSTRTIVKDEESKYGLTQAGSPASPLSDRGSLLILGGFIFATAGVVWLPINLIRLRKAHIKGKELASTPVNPHGTPVVSPVSTPVARPRKT